METPFRITAATVDVLEALWASPVELHGFALARATGKSTGSVYPILVRMERAGWLQGRWETEHPELGRPRRRFYGLTSDGLAAAKCIVVERYGGNPAHLLGSKHISDVERDVLCEDGASNLPGSAESFPGDEEASLGIHVYEADTPRGTGVRELSPAKQAIGDAIAGAIVEALEIVAREAVVPVFKEAVAPAVKLKLSDIVRSVRAATRKASGRAGAAEVVVLTAPQADSSREVDAAVEDLGISMSGAEFRERLAAALLAEKFAAEQKGMLRDARIEEGDLPPELQNAIKSVLEGNVSMLDEETLVVVVKFLAGARIVDGEYVLPRSEEAKEVPRFTAGS
ncbi:PadR family transcriptional regulator [Streptomyces antibioticus]|uniref:PadR family transcriptional regulator n=1 Tax=Streptomyces antibioticus TaxID=1890 RepID=UPI00371E420D